MVLHPLRGLSAPNDESLCIHRGMSAVWNDHAKPLQVIVDAGYSSRQNIVELQAKGVEMVGSWVQSDGRVKHRFARVGVTEGFLPSMFNYDQSTDTYRCPEGKLLRRHGGCAARLQSFQTHGSKRSLAYVASMCAVSLRPDPKPCGPC